MGDPLVLGNLKEYIEISAQNNLKINITTTANNLQEKMFETLSHEAVKQVNFSINSYNANSHKKTLHEYLAPIIAFSKYVLQAQKEIFINFRIWNLDEAQSAKEFNAAVFSYLSEAFGVALVLEEIYEQKPKSIKVARKIFVHFDEYFVWPSLENEIVSKEGFCYGLDSHFGILSSEDVVPCCLDKDGVMKLGNVLTTPLEEILQSSRALSIKEGFKKGVLHEELCQKCSYRECFVKS